MQSCWKLTAYLQGFKAAVRYFHCQSCKFQSAPQTYKANLRILPSNNSTIESNWPNTSLGPIDPPHPKCPLPGNTGIIPDPPAVRPVKSKSTLPLFVVAIKNLPRSKSSEQIDIMKQVNQSHLEDEEETSAHIFSEKNLECFIVECPLLLRKEFAPLFPDRNFVSGGLTAISLCQKTINDMSSWSSKIEEERDQLLELYTKSCLEICDSLQKCGFWSDFIDPSSGKPYLGAHTNASLFETDPVMRHFGCSILDLGCCKVISHHKWGTQAYVGILFTDAPVDHPMIAYLDSHNSFDQ